MKLFYTILLTLFVSISVFSQDYMGCDFGVSTAEVKTYFDKFYNRTGEISDNVVFYVDFYKDGEYHSVGFDCLGGTFKSASIQYFTTGLGAGALKYSSICSSFTKLYGEASVTDSTAKGELAKKFKQQGIQGLTSWKLSTIRIQLLLMKNNNVCIIHSPVKG